jgi:hypothetical protein
MHSEIHRATRFPFAANVEVTDVRSERLVTGRTSDLSVFGCYVRTTNPFPVGTKITLRITHDGASFTAFGKVVYFQPKAGMGLAFAKVEPTHQTILEKWIANLRKK